MVKVLYRYIIWLSRYSRYSELLPLNVMLLRNMMLYWTGSVKTTVSRESFNVSTLDFHHCASEDLHVPVNPAS